MAYTINNQHVYYIQSVSSDEIYLRLAHIIYMDKSKCSWNIIDVSCSTCTCQLRQETTTMNVTGVLTIGSFSLLNKESKMNSLVFFGATKPCGYGEQNSSKSVVVTCRCCSHSGQEHINAPIAVVSGFQIRSSDLPLLFSLGIGTH